MNDNTNLDPAAQDDQPEDHNSNSNLPNEEIGESNSNLIVDTIEDEADTPLPETEADAPPLEAAESAEPPEDTDAADEVDQQVAEQKVTTPFIPDEVFKDLPEILKKGCQVFDQRRERDVFFTGALAILSGCLPSVAGLYRKAGVYPNLYCFIVAPAASGKGVMVHARALGEKYHDRLRKEGKDQMVMDTLQSAKTMDDLQKPVTRVLFIPGNISGSAMIKHLADGDESGILCETEADTLANSIKQDWGNFSDMLRKAFHHETISCSRVKDNEYLEVKKPKISVALTGTHDQVSGILHSAEDGLFSRFIFYLYDERSKWQSVAPGDDDIDLNEYFSKLSDEVVKAVDYLNTYPTKIKLTKEQWEALDKKGAQWLEEVNTFVSEEAGSSVFRLGLIIYRMIMVLTALRKYDDKKVEVDITCTDKDFETALKLAEVYKEHAISMFRRLPKSKALKESMKAKDKMMVTFYDALPLEFPRKDAVVVGQKLGMEERTVDNYLASLLSASRLTQPKFGHYSKPK